MLNDEIYFICNKQTFFVLCFVKLFVFLLGVAIDSLCSPVAQPVARSRVEAGGLFAEGGGAWTED